MLNKETNDIFTIAIELTMFGVLCVLLVYFAISSRAMYSYKDEQEALQEVIKDQSNKYFFEYGEHINGADIVEFILKYDATYDYYISLKNGTTYSITKAYAKEIKLIGQDSNVLWSQEYLTNTVLGDYIYKEFTVVVVDKSDNSIDYIINEK